LALGNHDRRAGEAAMLHELTDGKAEILHLMLDGGDLAHVAALLL
jgi:hypothetical protein